jgi:hypothetical protein
MFLKEIPIDNIKKLIKMNIIENKMLKLYKVYLKNNFEFYTDKVVSDEFYEDNEEKKTIKLHYNGIVRGALYVGGLGVGTVILFVMIGCFIFYVDERVSINTIVFYYYN